MKNLWLMLVMMVCVSACSSGGDDPVEPTPTPEVIKPEITIDAGIVSNGLSFNAAKGENTLSFTTNTDWSLSIAETRSGATWCTASPTSGSKGTANVKFTTTENTEYEDRSVTVTIKAGTANKTFKITQKAADALLVTTTKYEVPKEGGQIEIEVKSNIDYQMAISKAAKEWIVDSGSNSRALNTHKHVLDIAANEDANRREGEITFKSGNKVETVKVYQAGEAVLLLSQSEYTVSDAGETISVDIKSNVEYDVLMPDVDWLIDESSSRGLSSHTMKFAVAANETHDSRSAEIIFSDRNSDLKDTLKVIQVQKDAIILSQKEVNVKSEGETIEVKLSANVDFEVAMPDVDWITKGEISRALSNSILTCIISANETNDSRSTEIVFHNEDKNLKETLKITQIQNNAIVISKKEYDVNPEGETIEVELNSNVDFDISIEHDWITQVESKSSRGLVSHKLYFQVAGNDTKEERNSKINITDKNKKIAEAVVVKQKPKGQEQVDDTPYLSFSAKGIQTLTMTKAVETLEYSVNGGEWKELGTNTVEFGGEKGDLRLRGMSAMGTAYGYANYSSVKFGTNVLVTSSGDINSLVDYKNINTANTKRAKFCCLFLDCNVLTTAPKLSAITLDVCCYWEMFKGCTNLVEVPDLPANKLLDYSCYGMFSGCTSLVNAPKLPATSLAEYCYNSMFEGCTSLVNAPELSATNLGKACYSYMFRGCTSLVNVPKLPATTLKDDCYSNMFSGCTSLINVPELPAITLADYCYWNMFSGCTSLVDAPKLPATTLKRSCYMKMFGGCTSLVNASELPATTLADNCYRGMFGHTGLIEAPELPATDLVDGCYSFMFEGCTNLKEAPQLPALDLAEKCYESMFANCKSLTGISELPAITLSPECYYNMFSNCTSLVNAPKLPATTLAEKCYWEMFKGCTSLVNAPKLPATTLANLCYSSMFEGCTNLIIAPELPATTLKEYCYGAMFYGCTNLKEAPQLPALGLAVGCYDSMFEGCTSLATAPVLPAPQMSSGCYTRMFYGCTNLNKVTFLATDISGGMYSWLKDVSSTGIFIKAKEMDISTLRGVGAIPDGWAVKDWEDIQDSSANGNMENPNESNSSEW